MDPITNDQHFSPELLRIYYDRLFPYREMFNWLSYYNDPSAPKEVVNNDRTLFQRREFSFTLADDIYVRHRSFVDARELKLALQDKLPHKIDIGAIYNAPPSAQGSNKIRPEKKELVLDIDMTDYDNVRQCCSAGDICGKCWPYMTAAIKVLDAALRKDLGFNHILWVYSGRRGVHCWVCDERARALSNEARASLVDYLSAHQMKNDDLTEPLHPSLKRALDILEPYFRKVCVENQRLFDSDNDKGLECVMKCAKNDGLKESLQNAWSERTYTGQQKWTQFKLSVEKWAEKAKGKDQLRLKAGIPELIFSQIYPRLDVNVTKQMHHLLKSPFCVHPKTGRVCVPIDPNNCDKFDPLRVPTLDSLVEELQGAADADVEQTSLHGHLQFFRDHFLQPLYKSVTSRPKEEDMF